MTHHGKWSELAVQHKDWQFGQITDNGECDFGCEMRESEYARHEHHITHDDYIGELRAGCVRARTE
jgi:hypothetical protein